MYVQDIFSINSTWECCNQNIQSMAILVSLTQMLKNSGSSHAGILHGTKQNGPHFGKTKKKKGRRETNGWKK